MIVRDVVGHNNVSRNDINSVLGDLIHLQAKQCDEYWGAFRSAADHGFKDIVNPQEMIEAQVKAYEVQRITILLIRQYIELNQRTASGF